MVTNDPIQENEQRVLSAPHHNELTRLFELGGQFKALFDQIVALMDDRVHHIIAEATNLSINEVRDSATNLLIDTKRGLVTRLPSAQSASAVEPVVDTPETDTPETDENVPVV